MSFSVCPAPDRHGVALLNVLKALAPRYRVDVLTLRTVSDELPFVERFMRTRMLRVPVGSGTLVEQVDAFERAVRRQLEGEEYDLVHLRSAWGASAVLEGTLPPMRLVYEVARSTEGQPRAADAEVQARLSNEERACLSRADLILVPSEAARQTLVQRYLGDRVAVVTPGVDVDHFDWEPSISNDVEEPAPVARVLYVGRIAAGRGVRLLIRAVAALRHTRRLKLVLAGPVEEAFSRILDEALVRAGLSGDDVERLPPISHEDVPRLLATASICVAPASPDENDRPLAGFPTKILEYMACRRAVVAPRRGSVEEVISDGEHGLLFTPGDADSLALQLARLLDNPELRDRLAASGYARVRALFPASATRRQLLAAYARLAPPSGWTAPTQVPAPLDAFPAHSDTTTARRPKLASDGRARGDRSGEIIIRDPAEVPLVTPAQVLVDATVDPTDFEIVVDAPDLPDPKTAPVALPTANEPQSEPRSEEDEATHPHAQGPLHRGTPSG